MEFVEGSAEAVPLQDATIDAVVTTWTLCSIPDAQRALREMRRVLKPLGRLLFVEHGLAPEPNVRWWQDRLTPWWKPLAGGCHLNRPMRTLIEGAGFDFDEARYRLHAWSTTHDFHVRGERAATVTGPDFATTGSS